MSLIAILFMRKNETIYFDAYFHCYLLENHIHFQTKNLKSLAILLASAQYDCDFSVDTIHQFQSLTHFVLDQIQLFRQALHRGIFHCIERLEFKKKTVFSEQLTRFQ